MSELGTCTHTTVRAQLARCLERARGSWGGQEGTGVHSGSRVEGPACRGPAHPLLLSREYRRLRDLLWLGHWPCWLCGDSFGAVSLGPTAGVVGRELNQAATGQGCFSHGSSGHNQPSSWPR